MTHICHNTPHPDAPPPSDPLYRFWPAPGKRVRAWTPRRGYWFGVLGQRQEYPDGATTWEVFAAMPDIDAGDSPSYYSVNAREGFDMLDEKGQSIRPCVAWGYPEGIGKPR